VSRGPTVLHLQKVAGISGSEAHLISLLPRLKERGWDVRFLMLHEDEPGAWDFAGELTARGMRSPWPLTSTRSPSSGSARISPGTGRRSCTPISCTLTCTAS